MKKIVLDYADFDFEFEEEVYETDIVIFNHKDNMNRFSLLHGVNYEKIKNENLKPYPLFVYNHSIEVFQSSRTSRWDSGRIGTVYAKNEKVLQNTLARLTDIWNGFGYNLSIVNIEKCSCCGHVSEEIEDSVLMLQSDFWSLDNEEIKNKALDFFYHLDIDKNIEIENRVDI